MNCPFIDIHCHDATPTAGVLKIANLRLEQPCPTQGFYSYGIHPWDIDAEGCLDEAMLLLASRLASPQAVALGETGLDKAHPTSYARQMLTFEQQITISERMLKPLILHDVHSHNEIIALHKKHQVHQPWIVHGFNGTEHDIRQLCSRGIYLSVGEALLHPERKISKAIKGILLDQLFIETDTAHVEVREIYERAAFLLEMPLAALKEQIFCNFARIFK